MILWLWACTGGTCEPLVWDGSFAVSTADPLFSVGSMALGDGDGVQPGAFGTSADSIVRSVGERLYVVERGDTNAVAAFAPGETRCPLWQTPLPEGSNAHDLVGLDGRLYLPLYDGGEIAVLEEDGTVLESIAVPGEEPALDRAVVHEGRIWVADQRFDRTDFATSEGVLLEVDPALGVVDEFPAGSNPRLFADFWVATGLLSLGDDPVRRRDGDVRQFDPLTRSFTAPVITEASLDADVHAVANGVLSVVDAQAHSRLHCLGVGDGPSDPAWFVSMTPVGDELFVAARASLSGADTLSERGVFAIDPATCARTRTVTDDLDPYDIVGL